MTLTRALIAILIAAPAPAATPPAPATIWYSIVGEGGETLGHASQEMQRGPSGPEIVQVSELNVQELDNPPTRIVQRTVTRSDGAGRPVWISDYVQTGRNWARQEAIIGRDSADVTRVTAQDRRRVSVPLSADVRFDDGIGLLRGWNMAATPRLEFRNFDLSAMAVLRVVIEPAPGVAPDAEGRITLLRTRYEGDDLRAVARLVVDRERRLVALVQPMFGSSTRTSVTDRETALRRHPPFHALRAVMFRSPFRISDEAGAGHIRYRFTFRDQIQFRLPQTGEQQAIAGPNAATVDICGDCGPGLAHDPAYLADARRPTPWMQSDDPRIRAISEPIARLRVSDSRKMELLLAAARPYLGRVDFAGHFSALETLQRRAGDCTEASVLLGALGRAAGIPTRVVNGLAYSRARYHGVSNVFMPHSWTLAYVDGGWRSFDLALDTFDSTHIALTIGDGDARSVQAGLQLASLLQWDSMAEVRARPAG